jgi:hypothetical protein
VIRLFRKSVPTGRTELYRFASVIGCQLVIRAGLSICTCEVELAVSVPASEMQPWLILALLGC